MPITCSRGWPKNKHTKILRPTPPKPTTHISPRLINALKKAGRWA